MFGFVSAQWRELTRLQQARYESVYCGICRAIARRSSALSRLGLSYDMAFLALLLMSLYEPEEERASAFCALHPLRRKPWTENRFVDYAADMNVILAYDNCLDDWEDDRKLSAKLMARALEGQCPRIRDSYPRQCRAVEACLAELSRLEKDGCKNPDEPASAFGRLMAELMVYEEDMWADTLRQLGFYLGRFIYFMDAAMDYDRDAKKGKYNPFLAEGLGKQPQAWEEILVQTMGRCTEYFEKLPLVQDKDILNNILYSGVWTLYRGRQRREQQDGRSV